MISQKATQAIVEIEKALELHSRMKYFLHTAKLESAAERRVFENKNSKTTYVDIYGKAINITQKTRCCGEKIYYNIFIKINNRKKTVADLKKIIRGLEYNYIVEV